MVLFQIACMPRPQWMVGAPPNAKRHRPPTVASGAGLVPGDELRTESGKTNLRHSGLTGWSTAKCTVSNLEVAAFQ